MYPRYNLFLDLDNTLVSAYKYDELAKKPPALIEYNMDNYYAVFERPYLQHFLDFIFENFNVSVWTAASQSYALFIIDKIIRKKKSRQVNFVLFSYHCKWSRELSKRSPKSLKLCWDLFKLPGHTKENTIIIDDLDLVYKHQPQNCIPVFPFEATEKNSYADKELLRVEQELKAILKK